jgi:hypothetical protein
MVACLWDTAISNAEQEEKYMDLEYWLLGSLGLMPRTAIGPRVPSDDIMAEYNFVKSRLRKWVGYDRGLRWV